MGFPVNNPFDLRQVAQPSAPAAGTTEFYSKSDSKLYTRISSGHEPAVIQAVTTQITSDPAPAPTGFIHRNMLVVLAQAVAAAFAAPSGTAVAGNVLSMDIKDNGSAKGLTWDPIYRAFDAVNMPLPTTTIAGKWMYLLFKYNAADVKWDLVGILNQS